jgi:bifunctional UDP-N-acetylglucosamine pyrophosphorylase/glucosamine-1-phosphate N-acetyltransferase
MHSLAIIILAAGKGTRMKSDRAKVLHPLLGRPLLGYVLDTAKALRPEKTVVVIGHQGEQVRQVFDRPGLIFVTQSPQLGTGHAVLQTSGELNFFPGTILVLSGDVPLIKKETLKEIIRTHRRKKNPVTLLSTRLLQPLAYGRIIRDPQGGLKRIVEEKDATPEERLIEEVNAGIYCFDSGFLFSVLPKLSRKNRQGEYYLTDVIQLARESGHSVSVLPYPQSEEVLGINDRTELARTGLILRRRVNEEWMRRGVTLLDPENTYIESTAKIGLDTTIGPFTLIAGRTRIGARCLVSSQVILENAVLDDGVSVPPFSHIKDQRVTAQKKHVPVITFKVKESVCVES